MTALIKSLACLLVIVVSISARAQMANLQSVPMRSCRGLPCVDATVRGHKLRLLIDTGDVDAFLDESSASRLGLELRPVHGADGKPVSGYRVGQLDALTIGNVRMRQISMLVTSLRKAMNNHVPDADGALTYPVFKDRVLKLDYKHHLFSISEPLTNGIACVDECGSISYSTFGDKGPQVIVAQGFVLNGSTISAQIDTLFTGTLLVYPQVIDKLGLQKESESKVNTFFPFTDNGVEMAKGTAHAISFRSLQLAVNCPLYFATPQVHTPQGAFDATVGSSAFTKAIITFDFHDNWISVAH